MEREKMLEHYFSREPVIFKEEAGSDERYHALLQRKADAEKLLRKIMGDQAWKQYLVLDEACNELESYRYQILYLAGAADHEKLNCKV